MNLNLLKGMLIVLVVLDHNDYARSFIPGFLLGMSFHVVGFMAIPFLKTPPAPWGVTYGAYLFRLYWPFAAIASATALLLGLKMGWGHGWLWWHALYSGDAATVKAATGLGMLWFLPSFIALVTLWGLYSKTHAGGRAALWALVLVAHAGMGPVAPALGPWLPSGLLPALYMFPLGFACAQVQQHWLDRARPLWATAGCAVLFGICKSAQMTAGLATEVGFAQVASAAAPPDLLLNDLEALSGTLLLFQLARCRLPGFLERLGEVSLQVYLLHAFVAFGVVRGLEKLATGWPLGLRFAVALVLTVALTYLLVRAILAAPLLRRLLFPRSPADLLGRGETVRPVSRSAADAG